MSNLIQFCLLWLVSCTISKLLAFGTKHLQPGQEEHHEGFKTKLASQRIFQFGIARNHHKIPIKDGKPLHPWKTERKQPPSGRQTSTKKDHIKDVDSYHKPSRAIEKPSHSWKLARKSLTKTLLVGNDSDSYHKPSRAIEKPSHSWKLARKYLPKKLLVGNDSDSYHKPSRAIEKPSHSWKLASKSLTKKLLVGNDCVERHQNPLKKENNSYSFKQEGESFKGRSSRVRRSSDQRSLGCSDKTSCRHKCSSHLQAVYEDRLICYCDPDCEFFEDCCADYDDFCLQKANAAYNASSNAVKSDANLTNIDKDLWSYFGLSKMRTSTSAKGIWMISTCPKNWPKNETFYQCNNLSTADTFTINNYQYLPVFTSDGTVYHNRFCAQCNGEALSKLKSYKLSMVCDLTPPSHFSVVKKVHFYFTNCKSIGWDLKDDVPRRYRIPRYISSCTNKSKMYEQCVNGKVRIVNNDKTLYKNLYCAQCHEVYNLNCGLNVKKSYLNPIQNGFNKLPVKSMTILFDFSDVVSSKTINAVVQCSSGKVFDHHLGACRQTLQVLPKQSQTNMYKVLLWFDSPGGHWSTIPSTSNLNQEIARNLKVPSAQVNNSDMRTSPVKLLEFHLSISLGNITEMILNILDFQSEFNMTIANRSVIVFKATTRVISCTNLKIYQRHEYIVSSDDPSAVIIKETGAVLNSKDYYMNGTSANYSLAIFVCYLNPVLLFEKIGNCSWKWVLIEKGEFTMLENKSIFVNTSMQIYNHSEYIWQNGSLYVCKNVSNFYIDKKTSSTTVQVQSDIVMSTMTLVCMAISITALVFVLVTYSLFTELRTPPGINLMNLSVSILLAQLLWLLGSGQTDKPVACTVIAVLLHYLFLVSFVWSSIIAFDTWRAFTAKGTRSFRNSNHDRRMQSLRYMAVGWLSVMMYVAICVVLEVTKTVNIGYQSNKACWMSNPLAILYFFAVPFVLIQLFNMTLYIMTMRAINKTTEQARLATDHKDGKKRFGIYVRIGSIMGFTWILGFIAPFGLGLLWYPYIVLNGLQGVYIASSFGFNQRVRKLYKKLFGAVVHGKVSISRNESVQSSVTELESRL